MNAPDHPADAEQPRHLAKHRNVIEVEAEHIVTEQAADVEEIAGPAAEIENMLRARQIELDLADAADVDVDPTLKIKILGPIFAGMFDRVSTMNPLERCAINCFNDAFGGQWNARCVEKSSQVASRAGEALTGEQFFDFVAKLHGEIDRTRWHVAAISFTVVQQALER